MFYRRQHFFVLIIFAISTLFITCRPPYAADFNPGFLAEDYSMSYALYHPDAILKLSKELDEISGMAYSKIQNGIAAINDDFEFIYIVDRKSGAIIKEVDFGKKNDYEGVMIHDEEIYVVESNGHVKVLSEQSLEKLREFETALNSDNNIEGISFLKQSNSILYAAKGDSKIDGDDGEKKAIFISDMEGKVNPEPFITIDLEKEIAELTPFQIPKSPMAKVGVKTRTKNFRPSGIAIHPQSDEIFILSAGGRTLMILDKNKNTKGIFFLNNYMHQQPEGICFDDEGTLYIANEGRANQANLIAYRMKKNDALNSGQSSVSKDSTKTVVQ